MNATNLINSPVNPNIEKFYKGFNNFSTLNVEREQVTFKVPIACLEDAYKAAQDRINLMCLDLSVERTGRLSNTFIVKVNEYSSFERVSEMLEVRHV